MSNSKQTYKISSEQFNDIFTGWSKSQPLEDSIEFFEQDVCGLIFEHFTESERVYTINNVEKFAWARIKYSL